MSSYPAKSEPLDSLVSADLYMRQLKTDLSPCAVVIGQTILDIQCKRGYYTVCAPDGPDGCPEGYLAQTNVGQCGFATLNHYLNTTNIAGQSSPPSPPPLNQEK